MKGFSSNTTSGSAAEASEMEAAGGRAAAAPPQYSSGLSARQLESLSSLCDTFVPSLDVDPDRKDDEKSRFYRTSASMVGTPEHIGGLMKERLKHPMMFLVPVALWALSTGIGTFAMCGFRSLSPGFPYLQKFSRVPLHKREQILIAWSRSYIFLLRILFTSMKFLVLLVYFTQVDEKEENPSWKAIGYCGTDPDFKRRAKIGAKTFKQLLDDSPQDHEKQEEEEESNVQEQINGPLHKGIVHLDGPKPYIFEKLQNLGFSVSAKSSSKFRPSLEIKCDAVVVGSGSGGGVVAGILANAGYSVLVLEKGNYHARNGLSLLEGSTMDQMYLGSGLLASKAMDVMFLAGATVGGGSTVNWSASIRTPSHVLREWSELHELELFDSKLYTEALDSVCRKMGVQSEFDDENFNNMVLRKGCQELGYPVETIPRNASSDHYCGWCCFGCKDGRKKGTQETWLVDLVNSGNGAILPGCEAVEVLHERKHKKLRKQATGVAFRFRNHHGIEELCVVKSKVTIVACGALSTPKLLKNSGLRNPNIGKNLHIHPVAMAWGYFPDESPDSWPGSEKRSYEGGIMTAMSPVVARFRGSGYGALIQTPALHPGMFSSLMPWLSGRDMKDRMCRFSRTAHVFALARDKGSGELASPTNITYSMDKTDEENLKEGLEKVLRILASAGAEEIGTQHIGGRSINVKKVSYVEFDKFVKEESSRAFKNLDIPVCSAHQMGSCRMGVDPKSSAVNPVGETWEIEGLYVADTSVFPTALGVNPMVTVQAISYCTAQSVLESLRRKKGK